MKKRKNKKDFKHMTFEQLDMEIDKLPCNWMKPYMLTSIRRERPDYKYKSVRKENKNEII